MIERKGIFCSEMAWAWPLPAIPYSNNNNDDTRNILFGKGLPPPVVLPLPQQQQFPNATAMTQHQYPQALSNHDFYRPQYSQLPLSHFTAADNSNTNSSFFGPPLQLAPSNCQYAPTSSSSSTAPPAMAPACYVPPEYAAQLDYMRQLDELYRQRNLQQMGRPPWVELSTEPSAKRIRVQWTPISQRIGGRYTKVKLRLIVHLERKERNSSNSVFGRKGSRGDIVVECWLPVHVNNFKFDAEPGATYLIRLYAVNKQNITVAEGWCEQRATFSYEELRVLMQKAYEYMGTTKMQPFKDFWRCKPEVYWDFVRQQNGGIMKVYEKDDNGQAASPINGAIGGLFFSAKLHGSAIPKKSPFGDFQLIVPAQRMLEPAAAGAPVQMYFADFYCINPNTHYVTVVVCFEGSEANRVCQKRLIQLDPFDNPFLRFALSWQQEPLALCHQFAVNAHKQVWVEIFYTQDVPLCWANNFRRITATGAGTSKIGGLARSRDALSCRVCNLHPLGPPALPLLPPAPQIPQHMEPLAPAAAARMVAEAAKAALVDNEEEEEELPEELEEGEIIEIIEEKEAEKENRQNSREDREERKTEMTEIKKKTETKKIIETKQASAAEEAERGIVEVVEVEDDDEEVAEGGGKDEVQQGEVVVCPHPNRPATVTEEMTLDLNENEKLLPDDEVKMEENYAEDDQNGKGKNKKPGSKLKKRIVRTKKKIVVVKKKKAKKLTEGRTTTTTVSVVVGVELNKLKKVVVGNGRTNQKRRKEDEEEGKMGEDTATSLETANGITALVKLRIRFGKLEAQMAQLRPKGAKMEEEKENAHFEQLEPDEQLEFELELLRQIGAQFERALCQADYGPAMLADIGAQLDELEMRLWAAEIAKTTAAPKMPINWTN